MTVRRWVDAFCCCLLISIVLLRRMPASEAFLFGTALFLLYLPGYIALTFVGRQKYERAEAHVLGFALGTALASFGWLAALWLALPITPFTFIAVELLILFIVINIAWIRRIANGH